MSSDLKLKSSYIFNDATVIDNIHQSYIDISKDTDQESVQELVNEAITYLEKDIPKNIANELFSLMLKCFSYFPKLLLPSFNTLMTKSRSNSNFIITTVTILSHFIDEKTDLELPNYSSFVNDAINEIRPQIQQSEISIFGHKILPQFKYNLILNFLICSDFTMETISDFLPYIFASDHISNIPSLYKFIKMSNERNLLSSFPDSILNDYDALARLSNEAIGYFIPFISDQIFIQNLHNFEQIIVQEKNILDSHYALNIINKCSKLNLKLKISVVIIILFNLKASQITPQFCEYINQYRFVISPVKSKEYLESPYSELLFDKLSSISFFTDEQLIRILKQKTNIEIDDLSSSQFYIDIYSFFNNNDYTEKLIGLIKYFIKKYVGKDKFIQIMDEMIFSVYPPTKKGARFLSQFLKDIDDEYRELFQSKDHMTNLLSKVLEKKVKPVVEFAEIIDYQTKIEMLQQPEKNQDPLLIYLCCFTPPKEQSLTLNEITILPQTNQSIENSINENDEDNESLSFRYCALLLVKIKNKINVKGLTKEIILQFYSIVAKFFITDHNKKVDDFLDTISSNELISLLIEGFKSVSNNQSPTVIGSVNELLKSFNSLFSENFRGEIVAILTPFLLNKIICEYFADKTALLLAILNNYKSIQIDDIIEFMINHCSEFDFKSNQINDKFEFNQQKASQLVINRIQNPSLSSQELIDTIYMIKSIFNFKLSLKFDNIQNLVRIFSEVFNENKIDEKSLISEFMIKSGITDEIYEKIRDKISMIPYNKLNDDELISVFVSDPKPETNNPLIEAIFNHMMKERSNRIGYLIFYFEKLRTNLMINPKALLNAYNDKYEKYQNEAFEAFDHIYELHPSINLFIKRAEFKPFELPNLPMNCKVVSQLYKLVDERPNDYRPFFCLKCIASSFPFIFSSNPQEILDHVLPKLNDFYLLFEEKPKEETKEQEEERINKFKTSFAAFSFLYTTLISNKIIDFVTVWYIKHYKELTKPQMFCFNIIFTILFSSFQLIMESLLLKHDFHEMFTYLMQVKHDDKYSSFFNENFNFSCYTMITLFYGNVFNKLEKIAMLSNGLNNIENMFDFFLDKHISNSLSQAIITSNPELLNVTDKIKIQNKEMINFIINVEDKKTFYVIDQKSNNKSFTISDQKVDSFIAEYKRIIPLATPDETPLPVVSFEMNDKLITYFLLKPSWVSDFLLMQKRFPTLFDHRKMLIDTINGITEMNRSGELASGNNASFILDSFVTNTLYNENFLRAVVEKSISLKSQPMNFLYGLMKSLITSGTNVNGFISIMSDKLDSITNSEDNWSCNSINSIVLLLNLLIEIIQKRIKLIPNLELLGNFIYRFFSNIGNKLIDIALQPKYRDTQTIMFLICKLLSMFPIKLPNHSTHLIGFMLLSKSKDTKIEAISFCSKFEVNELDHLEIIQNLFDQEIESENPNFNIINSFLKSFPSVGSARLLDMFKLLKSFVEKYQSNLKIIGNNESKNELQGNFSYIILETDLNDEIISSVFGSAESYENEKLEDNIISLIDFIAPQRDLNKSFTMSDSIITASQQQIKQNPNYKFYPIPHYIYDTMPQFWQFFDENRPIIDFIFLKRFQENKIPNPYDITQRMQPKAPLFSSRLVTMYPECFSFEFRSIYFRQKMIQKIKSNNIYQLNIDPNDIFNSSFRQLVNLNPEKWLYLFNIKYAGNIGADAGGLTKDWLTKLSQSIFNPNNELFECLENNENYIIKQLPNEPSETLLSMYRFAGMIVARALIQGELISAHLTRSLLKLILQHDVNPKDIEDADAILFNSLNDIKENKINDDERYDLYFDVTTVGGQIFELKPNGSQIKVTDENKDEYIQLMAEYRLKKSFEKQVAEFCRGFEDLIQHKDIRIFTPNELCLLICGVADIDIEEKMFDLYHHIT